MRSIQNLMNYAWLLAGILLIANIAAMGQGQPESQLFPQLKAKTLSGDEIIFPDDLNSLSILILLFDQNAQYEVDTWASMIFESFESQAVSYYEIPMMSTLYKPIGWQIDQWMRDGIPDKYHGNTATFYGDRSPYFNWLDMTDKSTCYLFVLDAEGRIIHRDWGAMDQEKREKLQKILNEKLNEKSK